MARDGLLQLRILKATNVPALVQAFRACTPLSISEIAQGLKDSRPLTVARLHTVDHDEVVGAALALLQNLKSIGSDFEIVLDGRIETPQSFNNLLHTWKEIAEGVAMEAALELGVPGIEALERLRQGHRSVFLHVLEQIERGEGFYVDDETMEWVKRELAGT